MKTVSLQTLSQHVGQELGVSEWLTVDQAMIDRFADATLDRQWIHVDPQRAAQGPFGATIAHGFLTLSLIPALSESAFGIDGVRMAVNYGLDRVRFPAPVPVGSRLRGRFTLQACEPIDGGWQVVVRATVERDGGDRPVCVADTVSRRYG